MFSVVRCRL